MEVLDRLGGLVEEVDTKLHNSFANGVELDDYSLKYKSRTPGVKLYRPLVKRAAHDVLTELTRGMTQKQIATNCATDLNYLSKFAAPDSFTSDWPELMVTVWTVLVSAVLELQGFVGEAKLALGIPRGFAKSTMIKLYCVFCILFTRHTFILIVGNTNSNAENIIKDVCTLLGSPQMRTVFGHYDADMSMNRMDEKQFVFNGKNVILKAKGGGTSLRGINVDNRRPDIILMDDVQDEENAASIVESVSLDNWLHSTLLPTVSEMGGVNLFIGNTYAADGSIMTKLINDPEWTSLTLGCILADGTSLWEELHPVIKLVSQYSSARSQGQEIGWLAQYMNMTHLQRSNKVDLSKVQAAFVARFGERALSEEWLNANAQAKYIIIDPATSKPQADEHSIMLSYVIDGIPIARALEHGVYTPMQTIEVTIKMCLKYGCPVVFVESVAYQATLLFWFKYIMDQMKLTGISLIEAYPGSTSKIARILTSFKQLSVQEVLLHPDVYPAYSSEAVAFNPLKADNRDNVLDAVHYLPVLLVKHSDMLLELYGKHVYDVGLAEAMRLKGMTVTNGPRGESWQLASAGSITKRHV